jgi:hypothetical protein
LSKNKFIYISDMFLSDIVGGGELNDHELCELLGATKIRSNYVDVAFLQKNIDANFIISNFIGLSESAKQFLTNNHKYVIYEHDHKYLKNRNPAEYKDYLAPKSEIINLDFYSNARAVMCQSSFHRDIVLKNLNIENICNISGNLWSEESLNIIETLSNNHKKDRYSILKSNTWHKNTSETSFYCRKKGYDYDLISSSDYHEFLLLLSNNDKFIFLPKTPETLSRVTVEARMLGTKTITNKNVGASYEHWYGLKKLDLINYMRERRVLIPNLIMEKF